MARFSWTQAACDECWEERNPGRTATRIRAEYATPETCVYCGEGTRSSRRDDPLRPSRWFDVRSDRPRQSLMPLSAEDLHAAADIVGSFGDDESRIGQEYGLPVEVLKEFIDGSAWRDTDPFGPLREMDPLALAIGVSIGVIAARKVTDEMVSRAEDVLYERSQNVDPPWPSSEDVRVALEAALGGP